MSGHAPFPPSSADRWMACTGSFALSLQMPEPPESSYAAEGSRLHDLAAKYLTEVEPVDPIMPAEDFEFLRPYLEYATERITDSDWHLIERKLIRSQLLSGTGDMIVGQKHLLEVVDLKTGAGVMVDPEENKQLLTYAYMALMSTPSSWPTRRVRLTIVQPPADQPIKSWDTTVERVLEHGRQVEQAIEMAISGQGTYTPGDHCRWCKAKPICPSLRGYVAEAGRHSPATLEPAAMGLWLDRAAQVEGFINDLRQHAHQYATTALAQQRPGIPGYVLKPKRATRQWADEDKVLEIARRRKIKIWQDKLMSPAMAEKAHPNMPAELTEQIVSISSGTNLVKGATEAPGVAPAQPSLAASLSLLKFRI